MEPLKLREIIKYKFSFFLFSVALALSYYSENVLNLIYSLGERLRKKSKRKRRMKDRVESKKSTPSFQGYQFGLKVRQTFLLLSTFWEIATNCANLLEDRPEVIAMLKIVRLV